jgi:hypothetical protein
MRTALAVLWLAGWAAFGVPWSGLGNDTNVGQVRWTLMPSRAHPEDLPLNFLYYVPAGALGIAFGWSLPATVVAGATLSATTELLQLFSEARVPAVLDFLLNASGTAAGAVLWRRRIRTSAEGAMPRPGPRADRAHHRARGEESLARLRAPRGRPRRPRSSARRNATRRN